MRIAIVLVAFLVGAAARPWTLYYRCDGSASPTLCHGSAERTKNFLSRIEAITFAESNEQFIPISIVHGKAELPCWWEYADKDKDRDNDERTSLAKIVDCDTDDRLVGKYCDEVDGCADHMVNHEK